MLLTKEVTMFWNGNNKKHFVSKGYIFTKMKDKFIVDVNDLSHGSKVKVTVECDYCGKIKTLEWRAYLRQHDEQFGDCCHSCCDIKRSQTFLNKYGVKNISQLDNIKEKKVQSYLSHYGTIHPLKSKVCMDKLRQTNMDKYGYEYAGQVPQFQDKQKQTCIEKYGVDSTLKSPIIRQRIRKTCEEKYNAPTPFESDIIQNNIKRTCIEKYGAESPLLSSEIQEKCRQTLYENGHCPTSSQQIQVYNILLSLYNNCELNYPVSRCSLDCLVNINDCKIDVEYDGQYWHKDAQKDRRRDEFIKSQGYKILRIKGNRQVPTEKQLQEAIDYLVKGNHSYTEIILDI